ncbi:hypothetical protein CSHISOI_11790, partial [Colletotrichum shisoi]
MGKLGPGLSTMYVARRPTTPLGWGRSGPPPLVLLLLLLLLGSAIWGCDDQTSMTVSTKLPSRYSPLPPASLASLFGGPCDNYKQSKAKQGKAKPRCSSIAIACAWLSDATEIQLANSVSSFHSCKFVIPLLSPPP